MKKLAFILAALAMVCVCVATLITWVEVLALDEGFYADQHHKLGTAQYMGMPEEDLDRMMAALLNYLKGDRPDIAERVNVYGEDRDAYDETETLHMVDVLALLRGAQAVRNGLVLVAVTLLAAVIYLYLKGHVAAHSIYKQCAIWLGAGTLAIALLAVFAYMNFDTFWTSFHELFFTNDLWLLNPNVSLMINILPGELFYALCMRIALAYALTTLLAAGTCLALSKRLKHRQTAQAGLVDESALAGRNG